MAKWDLESPLEPGCHRLGYQAAIEQRFHVLREGFDQALKIARWYVALQIK